MCGGPSSTQKAAQSAQAQLAQEEAQLFSTESAATLPFYQNILQNGIPGFNAQEQYSTSDLAQQINQAKTAAATKLAGYGSALPSGFASTEQADIGAAGAQEFDQNQLNLLQQQFNAKMAAANAMNPQSAASGAIGANQSVISAPTNNFWSNLIGGLISGAGQAFQGAGTAAVFGAA